MYKLYKSIAKRNIRDKPKHRRNTKEAKRHRVWKECNEEEF